MKVVLLCGDFMDASGLPSIEGILKSFQKPAQSIAERMRKITFRTRLVFDYLRMTKNSIPREFAR